MRDVLESRYHRKHQKSAAHRHVWRPDVIGSACFLISSALAWYEVCHGWLAWRPRLWSWWVTLANLSLGN
jgi:hypothetical protein